MNTKTQIVIQWTCGGLHIYFATMKLEKKNSWILRDTMQILFFFIFFYLSKYGDTIWMAYTLRFQISISQM